MPPTSAHTTVPDGALILAKLGRGTVVFKTVTAAVGVAVGVALCVEGGADGLAVVTLAPGVEAG